MKTLHTIAEVRQETGNIRKAGKTIGFVPTMGALHDGHLALVKKSAEQCDSTVVSVFVNPAQFGPNEDFNKYPRTLQDDARLCEAAGVDVIFAPSANEMYDSGFDTWVEVNGVAERLEGEKRPGHFRGVATVCAKLFNIVGCDKAFFGKKDYQQLKVIEKMVRDLDMDLEIVGVDIVRDLHGLALSSRNKYLSGSEAESALALSRGLYMARAAYEAGERDAESIRKIVKDSILKAPYAEIDYVEVCDAGSLEPVQKIDGKCVILVASYLGQTRLIDNTEIG